MIVIVPTGGSNLASVSAACERLGCPAELSEDPAVIRSADRVILPGVGHARAMMEKLHARGLVPVLSALTQPVLGICLGMQLLFEHSEEGDTALLGVIPGRVVRIPERGLVLPHMGWNRVSTQAEAPYGSEKDAMYYYFVHSYMAELGPWTDTVCDYGGPVTASVRWRNYRGTQFHPERSGSAGEALLAEFLCRN